MLEKNKLLLFPFIAGLLLMTYSWYLSYPLSLVSLDDFIFNHMSYLYWISLSLLLSSMFLIVITFKNNYLKWVMTAGIIITMFSVPYFYSLLPGSDSLYFRGINEYFIETNNLDFLQPGKSYLQWPGIFLLSNIATSVSGLDLILFEFLMYAIIGFLMASALYIYASKVHRSNGFIAAIVFFIAMYRYINYQFVPFTISMVFLFIMFNLDTRQRNSSVIITMLILFTGMTITHAYAPLFFVLYLFTRWIISRNKQYGTFFLLTFIIWLVFQITLANVAFVQNIWSVLNISTEVSVSSYATINPVSTPIDALAQQISTVILVLSVAICVSGFMILAFKRKLRDTDKAIFITAAVYFGLGTMLYVLGSRAIPIAFIPVTLGASYLFGGKFRPYLKILFFILLLLFAFIPLRSTFYKNDALFQTKEAYIAENFLIDNYDWSSFDFVLANYRVVTYLESRMNESAHLTWRFEMINETDSIFHTIGLELYLLRYNSTIEEVINEERLNVMYDNGFSFLRTKGET